MSNSAHITVLRHGDTPLTGLFCGSSDPDLTEAGWAALARRAEGATWDRVVASPLRRCAKFAESLDLPLTIDARFRELDFGDWEGKSTEDVWNADQAALTAFWEDPTANPAPGGEPWATLCARASDAFEELACASQGERILLLTHAGVMRSLLVTQLGLPFASAWKVALPTASVLHMSAHHDADEKSFEVQLTGLLGDA